MKATTRRRRSRQSGTIDGRPAADGGHEFEAGLRGPEGGIGIGMPGLRVVEGTLAR